jgi:hypothetical protein
MSQNHAYLFCDEHGREQEAKCQQEQDNYRLLGETMLVVTGPMKSPSFRCDRCHLRLRRGQRGYLVTAFPRSCAEILDHYGYAHEREHFVIEYAKATLYGIEPPGGIPALPVFMEAV